MQRALAERVFGGIAANAYEPSCLLDDSHTPLPPRSADLITVCKRAVLIGASSVFVVPTGPHLVCEALESDMTRFPASKTNETGLVHVHESIDIGTRG